MPSSYIHLDLKLHLETSLLVASDFARGRTSKLVLRDGQGQPIVPATTLKGRLRFYLQQFGSILQRFQPNLPQDIDHQLLGSANRCGQLFFADAKLQLERVDQRSGIKINRQLGSVEEKHLRTIETCPAYQVLSTKIEGSFEDGTNGHQLGHLLGALRLFDKLGAGKSSGLGRVTVEIIQLKQEDPNEMVLDSQQLLAAYVAAQLKEEQR